MPLGGIGSGTIAICGDHGLRQCQPIGRPNHGGWLPDSFFAIRCSQWKGERNESRLRFPSGWSPTRPPSCACVRLPDGLSLPAGSLLDVQRPWPSGG